MVSLNEHIKTLGKLDLTAMVLMYGANRVISTLSSSKNMLRHGGGRYFKWKYGDVYYTKTGEGSPIVLLHNVDPANSGYEWSDVVETLSKKNTVYTIDLPGCGRSAKPKMTYTNYFYVLFLTNFIKKIVKKKTDVIADAYSSSFAIMAASLDTSLIHHITAVNPYSIGKLMQTENTSSKLGSVLLNLPVLGTFLYNIDVSHNNIDYHYTENYFYNPFRSNDRFVDADYEASHYGEGKGKYLMSSVKGLYMTVNIKKALSKLGDKVTILYGEGIDHSKNIMAEYTKIDPDIRTYRISKAKYIPMMECPREFLAAYKKSLAERSFS